MSYRTFYLVDLSAWPLEERIGQIIAGILSPGSAYWGLHPDGDSWYWGVDLLGYANAMRVGYDRGGRLYVAVVMNNPPALVVAIARSFALHLACCHGGHVESELAYPGVLPLSFKPDSIGSSGEGDSDEESGEDFQAATCARCEARDEMAGSSGAATRGEA